MNVNPVLLEFPESFETERLIIRAPRPGDGTELNAAVLESLAELRPWMPWAKNTPTVEDSEANIRGAVAKFIVREDLRLLLFLKANGRLVGSSGLHRIDWTIPRFEIGYWLRTSYAGRGLATEAIIGIADFAQRHLAPRRIEIRMDARNERSWRCAERAGFPLEAVIHNDHRALDGALVDYRIYAKTF
ncbi:MAG: GNAT family N-acetyltransferase [Opitutaceae bacterium]|nr:GNAT family N-acetyltransferase [Opitutaceae bacterium]